MKKLLLAFGVFFVTSILSAQVSEQDFRNPPMQARPSTYWMWMNGNINKEGITKDLEYMKRASYGQAMMFNVGVGIPQGPVAYGTPEWKEMTLHACKEANRLGLELMMHNSPGYSGVGGPWISPEYAMQQLEWTETLATPDSKGMINVLLSRPYAKEGWYRDAYVLAYPALDCEKALFVDKISRVSLNGTKVNTALLADNDLQTRLYLTEKQSTLLFELTEPFEARAISVRRGERERPLDPHDGPRDYPPVLTLEASQDGVTFVKVATLNSPALREMDTPSIASFSAVKARFFRLRTNRSTNLSEVWLHSSPRLENWTAKTNYVKDAVGLGNNYQQVEEQFLIDPESVVDISDKMSADGYLSWKAPKGRWTIVRIGHTTTGEIGAAAPDSSTGLDCDKFSKKGVDTHFDLFLDPLLSELQPYVGTTLKALVMDSWEVGKQNWTADLPEYFNAKRGYDLRSYLLAMTGRIIGSIKDTELFLWDMRRTHADMFNENFLDRFKERAGRHKLGFAGEPYGDGNFESLEYAERLDYPMSEFWVHYIYGGVMTTKLAASTAHVSGRQLVSAECFTGTPFNSKFTEHPYAMKAEGDWMMTLGVNRFVYHVYAHQPYVGAAGNLMTMGPFGTHLNRNSTWAEQAVGLNTYNSRCAYMLQQGLFAADILYMKNEEISAGIPDFDVVEPTTPSGYKWDIIGRTALFERLSVEGGRIVLPDGMSYRLFVLPSMKKASPEVLRRIKELVSSGMTILLGDRPEGYMGMDEVKDREVQLLASELWENECLGKGRIYKNRSIQEVLSDMNIRPDFSFIPKSRDAQIHFIHRSVDEDEVYFITNHRRRSETFTARFRVSGVVPQLWDAETGETGIPVAFTEDNDGIRITLTLNESGSVFVVFRQKTDSKVVRLEMNEIQPDTIPDFQPNTFTLSLWAKPETFVAGSRGYLLYPMSGEKDFGKGHAYVGLSMGQNVVRIHERSARMLTVLEHEAPVEGWTHVALVYYSGIPTLYLNGKKIATGKASSFVCHPAIALPAAEEQYIGSFEGDMSAVKYAASALSEEEIVKEYTNGLPDPEIAEGLNLLKTVAGEWNLRFPVWSKAPEEITLPTLMSLHKHADFNVKHFSGTAKYQKTIHLTKKELKHCSYIYLDLGRVENIAEVTINGQKIALLWKAPYCVEITNALMAGDNFLVVEVTNLYPNRMIGDEQISEKYEYDEYGRIKKLPSWYVNQQNEDRERVLFSPWKHYTGKDPLLESGLTGPVRLLYK